MFSVFLIMYVRIQLISRKGISSLFFLSGNASNISSLSLLTNEVTECYSYVLIQIKQYCYYY